ncbi:hypothetical protein ASC80_06285 [Afipia sp. Root123D2]|nr:hypothetical protein ASC80_06285 [Afipia sp. Root123D2]
MVLRDGRYVDDLLYDGGDAVTVKIWNEREDCGSWENAPLAAMPREWLEGVKGAVESALNPKA